MMRHWPSLSPILPVLGFGQRGRPSRSAVHEALLLGHELPKAEAGEPPGLRWLQLK